MLFTETYALLAALAKSILESFTEYFVTSAEELIEEIKEIL